MVGRTIARFAVCSLWDAPGTPRMPGYAFPPTHTASTLDFRQSCVYNSPMIHDAVAQKFNARKAMRMAIYHGLLIPGPCAKCGIGKAVGGHHVDYSQPLFVVWLCRLCHSKLHAQEERSKRVPRVNTVKPRRNLKPHPVEVMLAAGVMQSDIARIHGISPQRVSQIKLRMEKRNAESGRSNPETGACSEIHP